MSATEAIPRTFGRYQLFDRIGRGGMADIYLARATTGIGASRRVVVKQILPELGGDPGFARMLIAEAKLAARLSHANVVQVFDLGNEEGRLFIAMEYVEGFDLHQLLRRLSQQKIPLPAEFAILIVREALRGLDYAHRARDEAGTPLRLVHRDVSPSNVLISFEGEVKLCDFGIARALAVAADATHEEAARVSRARVVGKSAYMAPEHARGGDLDARADVFAAGILLWELCAGRRLYRGSEEEMLAQARAAEIPPLPAERGLPDLPRLQAILDHALSPDPVGRFRTARDFLLALEDWAIDSGLAASQLRFGEWLRQHFAEEIVVVRRGRERAAQALELGPLMRITPLPPSVPLPEDVPMLVSATAPREAPKREGAADFLELSVADTARLRSVSGVKETVPAPSPSRPADRGGVSPLTWVIAVVIVLGAIGAAVYLTQIQ